jgi:hypothetical protein
LIGPILDSSNFAATLGNVQREQFSKLGRSDEHGWSCNFDVRVEKLSKFGCCYKILCADLVHVGVDTVRNLDEE